MSNFHNAKIVATMWPAVDKETVLSKVINNIDVFRIRLTHWDEETKRKYIDTILKLDSSKTVMLDTKGPEIRTRNKEEMFFTKDQKITIEYAEFFKYPDDDDTLFIDYPSLYDVKPWTIMCLDNDVAKIEITDSKDWKLKWKVLNDGTLLINKSVDFENYIPKLPFLSEKDKKQIVRWIDNKINVIAISYIRTVEDVHTVRAYMDENGWHTVKLIAKLETKECLENIESIIDQADWIIIDRTKLSVLVDGSWIDEAKAKVVTLCNRYGKPVIVVTWFDISDTEKKHYEETMSVIADEMKLWVDAFMFTKETSIAEEPLEVVIDLYERINTDENRASSEFSRADLSLNEEHEITDYIIYNAYRAAKELEIKAIICPTETGYTPARLSALKPDVPVISFTKNDEAYRYLNLLRWVKGYKISSTFEYANIKQIGKEIIRILFKWSISLDDKILIVHSSLEQNELNTINGMELYKFKDI